MIFYKRFIGDIQKDTGHLSLAEFGAYDRLLDHYYATETPLPNDVDACCRIARAMTKDERKAVSFVLNAYFTLTDGGYHQKRVEKELSDAKPKIEANKLNGLKGGRPKGTKNTTQEKPTGFSEITQSEPNDNLSHSQITILSNIEGNSTFPSVENQKPPTLVGEICKGLVSTGLPPFNQSNPKFLKLVEAGANAQEFVNTANEIKAKDPSKFNFDYLIGTMTKRRQSAENLNLNTGPMPTQNTYQQGITAAASSIFKPEHTGHLRVVKPIEIEVQSD
jgi:uncharacterized protein YdaU (DUF1376 family)